MAPGRLAVTIRTRAGARSVGRVALTAGLLLAVLAGAGFGYERLSRLGDAERYASPGTRYCADGRGTTGDHRPHPSL